MDSQVEIVAAVENALKDIVDTFKLKDTIPWCVLSHIDIQEMDHHVTKLVCNIADTALSPDQAARETITIIREMVGKKVNSSRRHGSV